MTWALVDMENFYVSAERVFDPKLRDVPLVVLSNNDLCCISRSAEAKAMGVTMGYPVSQMHRLKDGRSIQLRSSNYELYADMNKRFNQVLAMHSPEIEIYSIDESFVGLPTLSSGEGDRGGGYQLKMDVLKYTGLPSRVGLGPTKSLAKIANAMAKKGIAGGNGVACLHDPVMRISLLDQWPLTSVWGIAQGLSAKLAPHGVKTAGDLSRMPPALARRVGTVVLERLVRELNGEACELEAPSQRGTASATRQTGAPVTDLDDLAEAVARRVVDATAKLRAEGLAAGRLTCFAHGSTKYRNPPSWSCSSPLDPPTSDPRPIIAITRQMVCAAFREGHIYTKTGIILDDLMPEDKAVPKSLFAEPVNPDKAKSLAAVDALNAKFGRNTVIFASAGIGAKAHDTKREKRSPSWTTRIEDIPLVF